MSYGPPPPGGYAGPFGYGGPPPSGPPKNYLVHNVLGILSCTVIGVIGLVFALQVNSKWEAGDYAGAESAAQTAKAMGVIGMACFIAMVAIPILVLILILLFYVLVLAVMLGAMLMTV